MNGCKNSLSFQIRYRKGGSTSLSARIAGEAKPSWLPSLCNTSQTAGPPIQTKQCKHQSSLSQKERKRVFLCWDTDHHQSLTRSVIVHLVGPQRVRLTQEYWASLGNIHTESAGFSVLSFSSTPLPLATIMHSFCTGGCCHSINRNVHKNDPSWRNWISVVGSLCGKKTTAISRVPAMHFESTSRPSRLVTDRKEACSLWLCLPLANNLPPFLYHSSKSAAADCATICNRIKVSKTKN